MAVINEIGPDLNDVDGTAQADTITVTDTDPTSGDGSVTIAGNAGDDVINVTDGLDGDGSSSDVEGGLGNDIITVDYTSATNDRDDQIFGDEGDDDITVIAGDDVEIKGNAGSDTITIEGGTSTQRVNGGTADREEDGAGASTDFFVINGESNTVFIDDWHWDGEGSADDQLIIDGETIDMAKLFAGEIGGMDSVASIENGNTIGVGGAEVSITTTDGSVIGLDHATVTCYVEGTQIETPTGDVSVETLAIGDEVTTAEGKIAAIKWMGYRQISATFAKNNVSAQPVLITAGALGNGLPTADLRVSPDHAMFIDGVLVHAEALVNGATIVRKAIDSTFTYFHLELEQHDLVLANGAAAETFVDADVRGRFDNAAEYEALYGNATTAAPMALPRVKSKRQLPAAIKAKLDQAKTA
ncbi:MAG: Hint domain-containing protein [Pseudomonadota bacterium]|nr:Hint domain-containing protein [Pseudomonadota bacterium]